MKGYKIAVTIGVIIVLISIILEAWARNKPEFFHGKIGIIAGIIVIAIGVLIWVIDPIMAIFSKKWRSQQ